MKQKILFFFFFGYTSFFQGCSNTGLRSDNDAPDSTLYPKVLPEHTRAYRNGQRATREDFIDHHSEEGSLWAPGSQTNYYFIKNKIRNVGDLVVLSVEKDLQAKVVENIEQTLNPLEMARELLDTQTQFQTKVEEDLKAKLLGDKSGTNKAPTLPMVAEAVRKVTESDIDLGPSLDLKDGDTMVGEVVERYPNGNYKVKAVKRINYKKGSPRLVTVTGIVKSSEINDDTDIVSSGKLYDYNLEVNI